MTETSLYFNFSWNFLLPMDRDRQEEYGYRNPTTFTLQYPAFVVVRTFTFPLVLMRISTVIFEMFLDRKIQLETLGLLKL